jgi:hypothetical protein
LVSFNLELHRFSFLRVELPVAGYREAVGLCAQGLLWVFSLLIDRSVIVIGAVDTGEK